MLINLWLVVLSAALGSWMVRLTKMAKSTITMERKREKKARLASVLVA